MRVFIFPDIAPFVDVDVNNHAPIVQTYAGNIIRPELNSPPLAIQGRGDFVISKIDTKNMNNDILKYRNVV